RADIAKLTCEEDWYAHLVGIDAVVNCAGVLQDSVTDSTMRVHVDGMGALFKACEARGIRRVVHISAIGVDRDNPTAFSRTKLQGDRILMDCDLDWVVLRPAVVLGRSAFGGSALLRATACLPVLPVPPEMKPMQTVQLDEVTESVAFFLSPDAPSKQVLEVAAPERLSFEEIVGAYRHWLGWKPAPAVQMPASLARLAYGAGDLLSWLGWRPPLRSTARLEIARGVAGDPSQWMAITGIQPLSLSEALAKEPASVQEKWFAQLYLLKPLVFGVLALYWITTGIISLGPGWENALLVIEESRAAPIGAFLVAGGAIADILIGLGIACRATSRFALWSALLLSIIYILAGSVVAPGLWVDPLGPLLKIFPILALNLVALAILEER
ncbi:MAG: SDR family oxidoreductase, partial [Pseudomonadota bacterium]